MTAVAWTVDASPEVLRMIPMAERIAKRMGEAGKSREDFDRLFKGMPELVEYRAWQAFFWAQPKHYVWGEWF